MPKSASLTRVARAAEKAVLALKNRDDAIRKAHEDGQTMRQIAFFARLSSSRVHQIIHADDWRWPRGGSGGNAA